MAPMAGLDGSSMDMDPGVLSFTDFTITPGMLLVDCISDDQISVGRLRDG